MGRRLAPEETALWARVRASVRPLHPVAAKPAPLPAQPAPTLKQRVLPGLPTATARLPAPRAIASADTLDRSWDRKLSGGSVAPDRTIDLHGHTLASAHALLDTELERALARGDRVILLVTGKPPRPGSERPHARGAIRAHIADWLRLSRHAARIAAIRGAHPRHGGQGALYVILRRPRG